MTRIWRLKLTIVSRGFMYNHYSTTPRGNGYMTTHWPIEWMTSRLGK